MNYIQLNLFFFLLFPFCLLSYASETKSDYIEKRLTIRNIKCLENATYAIYAYDCDGVRYKIVSATDSTLLNNNGKSIHVDSVYTLHLRSLIKHPYNQWEELHVTKLVEINGNIVKPETYWGRDVWNAAELNGLRLSNEYAVYITKDSVFYDDRYINNVFKSFLIIDGGMSFTKKEMQELYGKPSDIELYYEQIYVSDELLKPYVFYRLDSVRFKTGGKSANAIVAVNFETFKAYRLSGFGHDDTISFLTELYYPVWPILDFAKSVNIEDLDLLRRIEELYFKKLDYRPSASNMNNRDILESYEVPDVERLVFQTLIDTDNSKYDVDSILIKAKHQDMRLKGFKTKNTPLTKSSDFTVLLTTDITSQYISLINTDCMKGYRLCGFKSSDIVTLLDDIKSNGFMDSEPTRESAIEKIHIILLELKDKGFIPEVISLEKLYEEATQYSELEFENDFFH